MNRLTALKQQLTQHSQTKQQINWVEMDIPYNLKDICKIKFKGQIRWNADEECWNIDETIADQFSKVFLEDFANPTKDEKVILRKNGANFDKNTKLWYFLKFQADDQSPIEEDTL